MIVPIFCFNGFVAYTYDLQNGKQRMLWKKFYFKKKLSNTFSKKNNFYVFSKFYSYKETFKYMTVYIFLNIFLRYKSSFVFFGCNSKCKKNSNIVIFNVFFNIILSCCLLQNRHENMHLDCLRVGIVRQLWAVKNYRTSSLFQDF